jgi:recombination protein RecT
MREQLRAQAEVAAEVRPTAPAPTPQAPTPTQVEQHEDEGPIEAEFVDEEPSQGWPTGAQPPA